MVGLHKYMRKKKNAKLQTPEERTEAEKEKLREAIWSKYQGGFRVLRDFLETISSERSFPLGKTADRVVTVHLVDALPDRSWEEVRKWGEELLGDLLKYEEGLIRNPKEMTRLRERYLEYLRRVWEIEEEGQSILETKDADALYEHLYRHYHSLVQSGFGLIGGGIDIDAEGKYRFSVYAQPPGYMYERGEAKVTVRVPKDFRVPACFLKDGKYSNKSVFLLWSAWKVSNLIYSYHTKFDAVFESARVGYNRVKEGVCITMRDVAALLQIGNKVERTEKFFSLWTERKEKLPHIKEWDSTAPGGARDCGSSLSVRYRNVLARELLLDGIVGFKQSGAIPDSLYSESGFLRGAATEVAKFLEEFNVTPDTFFRLVKEGIRWLRRPGPTVPLFTKTEVFDIINESDAAKRVELLAELYHRKMQELEDRARRGLVEIPIPCP